MREFSSFELTQIQLRMLISECHTARSPADAATWKERAPTLGPARGISRIGSYQRSQEISVDGEMCNGIVTGCCAGKATTALVDW
mmetsp:Transcript_42560/g.101785  ORF Transcript_42560/g.101785 Transcript_42560/m.101785 type:complete len:85 (+) Transcript_42560:1092-1346(+)